MKKTKLFLLTILITIFVMLFVACKGPEPAPEPPATSTKQLSDADAMNLIDTYDLTMLNGDFALALEMGLSTQGVNLSGNLNVQFKRTENFYNIYAKSEMPQGLDELIFKDESQDINSIVAMILRGGEFWLSDEKLMIKSSELKGYMNLPETFKALSVKEEDFNIANVMALTLLRMNGTGDLIFKPDGTLDWDEILAESGMPLNAVPKYKEIINILPMGPKGELQLSKFFKNFTTYNLSYNSVSEKNTIEATLNFDDFVTKLEAFAMAVDGVNGAIPDSVKAVFNTVKGQKIKFVLGEKFFESIEMSIALNDIDMLTEMEGFESLKNYTLTLKATFTFAPQTITFPTIDETWALIPNN